MDTRRTLLNGLDAGAGALGLPSIVQAQSYPAGQTIKVIVPIAPGGTTDVTGGLMADRWSQMWSTPVVVESAEAVGSSAKDFSASIVSERQRWGRIIKDLGIKTE